MEKLTEIQIKEGNRKLAEFMGYTFYHKGVDIDTSDIGGIYERFEVFSKVPIMVDEYPEEDQYYFSDFPNPDFKNAKEVYLGAILSKGKGYNRSSSQGKWNKLQGASTINIEVEY